MSHAFRLALLPLVAAAVGCGVDGPTTPATPAASRIAFVEAVVAPPDGGPTERHVGSQLAVVRSDGGEHRTLTPASGYVAWYDWAPRAGRLAYQPSRSALVHVLAEDGAAIASVDVTGSVFHDLSPDGTRLVVTTSETDGSRHLWVVPVDGGARREIAPGQGGVGGGFWSPDGQWIAYLDGSEIWKVRADGSGRLRVAMQENVSGIVWSPDGGTLALNAHDGVWLVRADGTNLRPVVGGSLELPTAAVQEWSPDGRRLLGRAESLHGGEPSWDVLVIRASDGVVETRLGGTASEGSWSPDGSRIAYVRFADRALLTVRADGSDAQVIRTGPMGFVRWLH